MWERQFLQSNNLDSLVQPSSCHNSLQNMVLYCYFYSVAWDRSGAFCGPCSAGCTIYDGPHMMFRGGTRVRVRRRFVTMVRIKAPDPILYSGAETNHPTCDLTTMFRSLLLITGQLKPTRYCTRHNTSPHATYVRT